LFLKKSDLAFEIAFKQQPTAYGQQPTNDVDKEFWVNVSRVMPNLIFGMNSAFPKLTNSSLQVLLLIHKNQPKSQGFKESNEHYMLQVAKSFPKMGVGQA
jgi:hypothetical protein